MTNQAQPIVFARAGNVFATSRDVAGYFGKRHDNVLRDIDAILSGGILKSEECLNFQNTPYIDVGNGQTYREFVMSKAGFTLLVFGFTGKKAMGFKLAYIDAFEAMESKLKAIPASTSVADLLANPAAMLELLSGYGAKVLALEADVSAMKPDVEALYRISGTNGSMSITEAAKNLQMPRGRLFDWLRTHSWIYRRPHSRADLGYADQVKAGNLIHKVAVVERKDGGAFNATHVRITGRGLTRLAKEFAKDQPQLFVKS